jgi:hypothetical protein
MNAATINLILNLIAELPKITETAICAINSLKQEQLSPEQLASLEQLEAKAREQWQQDLDEDRNAIQGAEAAR